MALGVISFTISVNCSHEFQFERPSDGAFNFFIAINIDKKQNWKRTTQFVDACTDLLRNALQYKCTLWSDQIQHKPFFSCVLNASSLSLS